MNLVGRENSFHSLFGIDEFEYEYISVNCKPKHLSKYSSEMFD